jgi:type IV pilus assembly protein PilM
MSFLGEFFGKKKSTSVIGIDIGSSSLKVVQLRRDGDTPVLETYGELALGPYGGKEIGQATNLSAEVITQTLKDLLREANVTTKEAGIAIPFARSLLALITLPKRDDPNEQKTIIELEARKYIPVPVTEVQLNWFILPENLPEGSKPLDKVKVLVVAVHNDELSLLQKIVQDTSIQASFYEIEIFSTIRATVDEQVKSVVVIDIGASATKVYVVEHGVVALSHNIAQGGQDVTRSISVSKSIPAASAEGYKKQFGFAYEGAPYTKESIEGVFSRIFTEVKRVITQFETGSSKRVETLILTGGSGITKDILPYAQQFFAIPVKLADPFGKVEAPAFMRPVLAEIGPEFAVAVGLALRKLEELS